jgi:ResB-like family
MPGKSILSFFKSVKLAIVLIIYGGILSIIGTSVPQLRSLSYYINNYPSLLSSIILTLKLDNISKSLIAVIPLILFILNLLVCTGSRLISRYRRKAQKRYGPDIIHLSLLFLIIGGVLSVNGRIEEDLFMEEGETVPLTNQFSLTLNSVELLSYDDGRAKDWLSDITLLKEGNAEKRAVIEVNKPLKFEGIIIYQISYRLNHSLLLQGSNGIETRINGGDLISSDNGLYQFTGNVSDSEILKAEFTEYGSKENVTQVALNQGFQEYRIKDIRIAEQSVLKYSEDPGVFFSMMALILMAAGLLLTVIQKIKEGRI